MGAVGPGGEAQADGRRAPRGNGLPVVERHLGAGLPRVHGVLAALDDVLVNGVLEVALGRLSVETADVGFVVAEEKLRRAVPGEPHSPGLGLPLLGRLGVDRPVLDRERRLPHQAGSGVVRPHLDAVRGELLGRGAAPGPAVAEPELRQEVDLGRLGASIDRGQADEKVLGIGLRHLQEDVEVAATVEDPGVEDLELGILLPPPPVLLDQPGVRELRLGVLVEHLEIGGGRGGIQVVVELLDVLAVVPLVPGQAEEPLFQDRIAPVPEGEGQTEPLVLVAEAADPVLPPAVGPAPGVVVREVVPGVAIRAVVLAHGPPLALGDVGAPFAPGVGAGVGFG